MIYGSVCSSIEAATVAWHGLGWKPAWFSEIEPFPCAVLAHHYPHVPNLGDMTTIAARIASGDVEAPDVLVGGTPCQAFSVAGARQSLDDERGQLTLEYVRLANEIDAVRHANGQQPCVIVWENVPGVLNTKDNAFGCFLGALSGAECELQPSGKKWTNAGCVYGHQRAIAWRILDAQYFGVAQRRRRVFVVASARKGFNPDKILFEWEGLRRDSPPSRSEGQDITADVAESPYLASGKPHVGTLMANAGTKLWLGNQEAFTGDYAIIHPKVSGENLIVNSNCFQQNTRDEVRLLGGDGEIAGALMAQSGMKQQNYISPCFGIPGNWIGRKPENGGNATEPMDNIAPCQTRTDRHAAAECFNPYQPQVWRVYNKDGIAPTLQSGEGRGNAILQGLVRRLTPTECERLQGFPDDYTKILFRNKKADQCPDGPRYAALGNSMAVPVMRWIGERIAQYLNWRDAA